MPINIDSTSAIAQRTRRMHRAKPRIALYSHDTMGMGHLRRNMLIAESLATGPVQAETLLIAGTREAGFFAEQAGLDCVTLPALRKSPTGNYSARHYDWSAAETAKLRGRVIASTLLALEPDIFIVDKLPQGICNELQRALHALRRRMPTRCVLGLRDILDTPDVSRREWATTESDRVIDEFFDEVWVYGDPQLYDCTREYQFCEATREKVIFTGYLDQTYRLKSQREKGKYGHPALPRVPFDLCVVGGGQDGYQVAECFAKTARVSSKPRVIITGPFMPAEQTAQLNKLAAQHSNLRIVQQLVEADHFVAAADRVVAMGGYNTVASILSFQKPALIIPRVRPRLEQWLRAERLAAAGYVSICHPDQISAERLQAWLEMECVPNPRNCDLNVDGLKTIEAMVANAHTRAACG